jgi:predicted phosphodiesterase
VRLGVLSDLHWTADPRARAAWHNAFDFAGLPARIDAARAAFARDRVDAVVACGDITHAGDDVSARAALARLSAGLERPVLVVPGNHDCLEREDQLERCGWELLTAAGVEVDGVRLAGVAIERDPEAGTFRWSRSGQFVRDERVNLVASHFPVLARAERLAEHGLAHPGDLTNRRALHECLGGGGPSIVFSGHIHARDAHARNAMLQLSAGALVEAPYEVTIVDVRVVGAQVRARRVCRSLGPPATGLDPVLAPADEIWAFGRGGWRRAEGRP